MVTFSFGAEGLTVSTSNPAMGDASEDLAMEWVGNDVKIGLNYEYVAQFLQQAGTDQIEVRLKDSSTQALFAPVGEESGSYQYVVMPMRLS